MHDSTIEARSEGEGRGAEFIVTLPLAAASARASGPASVPHLQRHRVLVADDNRDAADSLLPPPRRQGNEVSVAYDGVEAIEAARTLRPDVILLDIGMPRLDGYGAAREYVCSRRTSREAHCSNRPGAGADRRRARSRLPCASREARRADSISRCSPTSTGKSRYVDRKKGA